VLKPHADSPALLAAERAALMSPITHNLPGEEGLVSVATGVSSNKPLNAQVGGGVGRGSHGAQSEGGPTNATAKLKTMFGKVLVGLDDGGGARLHDSLHNRHGEGGGVWERELEVTVVSGAHLPKMDVIGKCDAFCILQYAGHRRETSVQSNTYSPIWDEMFTFGLPAPMHADSSSELVSASDHLTLHVWDHDTLSSNEKVGDAVVSGQRLCEIARMDSGSCVEERVLLFKRGPKSQHISILANSPHGKAGVRMEEVIGNDLEQTHLSLRIRVRPARQYPLHHFQRYMLDDVNASPGQGGAGVLRMALMLQSSADCMAEASGGGADNEGDKDFKAVVLRVTIFAPTPPATCSPDTAASSSCSPLRMVPRLSVTALDTPGGGHSPRRRLDSLMNMRSKLLQDQGILSLGRVQVRAVAARNLSICRLASQLVGTPQLSSDNEPMRDDCEIFLTVMSNGQDAPIKGCIGADFGTRFETRATCAHLGPVWMQVHFRVCVNVCVCVCLSMCACVRVHMCVNI